MYNKVEICGVNTARLKVLTNEEKSELMIKMKNGDEKAREELIAGNLRLVLSVMQKFAGRGESPDDLFQVGCVGLIKAVDNFDINQNVLFSTYAVPMNVKSRKTFIIVKNGHKLCPFSMLNFILFQSIRRILFHSAELKLCYILPRSRLFRLL